MTESSWPFENADTSEQQYSTLLAKISDTGVEGSSSTTDLKVTADSSGMRVTVNPGRANLFGFQYLNDAPLIKNIPTSSSQPRIDSVVLRLDTAANSIMLAVVSGTPSSNPAPPALQQSSVPITTWEERIANVLVPANATSISLGNVTDVRRFTGHKFGSWTTANRPVSPIKGKPGFNETLGYPEYWDGSAWKPFSAATVAGGTITGTVPNSALDYGVVAAFRNDRPIDAPINGDGISGDWNAVLQPGVYRIYAGNTNTNAPGGAYLFGTLMVFGAGSSMASRTQVYHSHGSQNGLYWRTAWNGNDWTAWSKAAGSGDVDAVYAAITQARSDLSNDYNNKINNGLAGKANNIAGAGLLQSGGVLINNFVAQSDGSYQGYADVVLPSYWNYVNPTTTANSADSGKTVATVTNVGANSFRIICTRRTNSATTVYWQAMGG